MEKSKQKQMQKVSEEVELAMREDQLYRARSITVGTAFGGTTEITMRGPGSKFLYSILQPVEVAELIHQLSANIGCHLALKPRDDFASWRHWKVSDEEMKRLNGHPPFPNDMAVFQSLGRGFFDEELANKIMNEHPIYNNIPKLVEDKKPVKQKRILGKKEIKEQ